MRSFSLTIDETNVGDVIDTPLRLFTLPGGESVTVVGQYLLNGVTGPCSRAALNASIELDTETAPGDVPLNPSSGLASGQLGTYTIPGLPITSLPIGPEGLGGSFSGSISGNGRDTDLYLRLQVVSGALDASAFSLRVDLQFEKIDVP